MQRSASSCQQLEAGRSGGTQSHRETHRPPFPCDVTRCAGCCLPACLRSGVVWIGAAEPGRGRAAQAAARGSRGGDARGLGGGALLQLPRLHPPPGSSGGGDGGDGGAHGRAPAGARALSEIDYHLDCGGACGGC
jgi:hypothetical protein|eukprot:SAG25_NODE_92_length_16062_cov_54.931095_6_plen_135_part_00